MTAVPDPQNYPSSPGGWSGAERRRPLTLAPSPGGFTITPTNTKLQLGLVIAIVLSTAAGVSTFVAASTEASTLNRTVEAMQVDVSALAKAAIDLNATIIELRGEVRGLSSYVGEVKATTAQNGRDANARDLKVAKLESDLQTLKDRLTTAETALKAIESRLISVEISASKNSSNTSTPRGGDEK